MKIVNESATLLLATDAAHPVSGLYLLDVLTRDAAGLAAVYRGAVTGDDLKADRAGCAVKIAFGGAKLTYREALAAFPDIPETEYRR